jgi:hypothetical protein
VNVDRCAAPPFVPSFATLNDYFPPSTRRDAQDDDDDEDDDEEEEDEDDEDEDEEGEGEDPSSAAGGSGLTRAERRELKKNQAAEKANKAGEDEDGGGGGGEDDLTANPNHLAKKLNISDLSAPRELTRRERYVPVSHASAPALFFFFGRSHYTPHLYIYIGSRRRRRRPRSVIGR